jgi:signal transduction histidine kinase
MHNPLLQIATILLLAAATSLGAPLDEYSDPRFPTDLKPPSNGLLEQGIKALEKQEQNLRQQLEQFPPLERKSAPQHQHFGYLSERHPVAATNEAMNAWVQLSFFGQWTSVVDGIGLVPAYYPELSSEENYGFPKRFKIEVFSHNEPNVPVTVVDWTTQDFPDPGLHPVFFSFPPRDVKTVRLTVTRGTIEDDYQFFALNELLVFQKGNNVAPPAYQGLTASGSVEESPYWRLIHLTTRKMHLGKYVRTRTQTADFIQYFDRETLSPNPPEIWIDLGQAYEVGRVELYPARQPGVPIPAFGFPLKYQIELRRQRRRPPIVQSEMIESELPIQLYWTGFSSQSGRYIHIILNELPEHNGTPALGLGEIRVIGSKNGEIQNLAPESTITTIHFPEPGAADTSLLVDGFSNGRAVIQERLHTQQLAQRKIVEQNLFQTRQRLMIARATRNSRLWTLGISGGTILFFTLILWIIHQRAARQRALMDLRQQIAADLHDDISSNLGTISMITKRLQMDPSPALIKDKLTEIGHIAQESFLSVKEIIWHMDSNEVYLSEMLERIEKTAVAILSDCRIECHFPKPQGIPVPARTRRNIMLLVKEALYNCSKYAHASHMLIQIRIERKTLELTMKDDGVGFDPTCKVAANIDSGRGLANMERRAKLLGADLDVQSSPNEGTQLTLKMSLNRE